MGILVLFLVVITRTFSDICFKFAVQNMEFSSFSGAIKNYFMLLKNPFIWVAGTLAIFNLFTWWLSLSYFDLSFAYPFTALVYIAIIMAGKFLFHEHIDRKKALGMGIITAGVALLILG